MPLTWTQAQEKFQRIAGDDTVASLEAAKSDMNIGSSKFNAALNRVFTRRQKSTDTVASQQYYQLPPDCIRCITVTNVLSDTQRYPLQQIRSEFEWKNINTVQQTSNWATYFFVRGNDEIGLWPYPAAAVVNGLEISYEARDHILSTEDYTTGTVTVTNGSTTLTGSGTVWTNTMVGDIYFTTDGSDGYSYTISGFVSPTELTLSEPIMGLSGSGKAYTIGETFIFPEEYSDCPVDYALSRYFEARNNPDRATYHLSKFNMAVSDAKAKYASTSSSQVVTENYGAYNIWQYPPNATTGVW